MCPRVNEKGHVEGVHVTGCDAQHESDPGTFRPEVPRNEGGQTKVKQQGQLVKMSMLKIDQ